MEKPGTRDLENGHILVVIFLSMEGSPQMLSGIVTSCSLVCFSLSVCFLSLDIYLGLGPQNLL